MAKVFQFRSNSELTAIENLESFIIKCREELTVFGVDLDWEAAIWPRVTVFAKLGVTTRKPKPKEIQDTAFINFSKAYFRYQQGHRPTGTKNESKALRAVEAALLQVTRAADIEGLTISVLDEATELARQHYSLGAAYQCGQEIERLANFVSQNKLVSVGLEGWHNPIRRPEDKNKTGKDAKVARKLKLPNETALHALAEIFANEPMDGRDIFTTSIFAMLMSAPSRITELLALPADCEVFDIDRDGIERYGWRFFSGKGYEGDIKWIPTVMVDIAKKAVSRVKKLSESARNLAKWIEENPSKFYRHVECPNVADNMLLTMKQACQALGLAHKTRQQCIASLRSRGLVTRDLVDSLNTLWLQVMKRLPEGFPWFDEDKGIKYSNALFVLNKNQFHGNRGNLLVELHKPTNNFFNNDLSPRHALEGIHKSIFDRHSYKSENGGRLKVTSHQARHLLNTIAQRGGLSNLEIAKWSGRANVRQNRTYNHMTDYELVGLAERFDPSKELFGPVGVVRKNLPVTIQEFNLLEHAAVHSTEYGFCVHDYAISPCEKYLDCINCAELVCIKGDDIKLSRIKERLAKSEYLFSVAESAVNQGDRGADRWYQYHQKTVSRLRMLVTVLENSGIEESAQIRLRGNNFSQLRRVIGKKIINTVEQSSKGSDESGLLNDLTSMSGDSFG